MKDLLDMTPEEVNALTDEQVFEYLDDIKADTARLWSEIEELKADDERRAAEKTERDRAAEARKQRVAEARKKHEQSLSI